MRTTGGRIGRESLLPGRERSCAFAITMCVLFLGFTQASVHMRASGWSGF
jgi:hypothetical protein